MIVLLHFACNFDMVVLARILENILTSQQNMKSLLSYEDFLPSFNLEMLDLWPPRSFEFNVEIKNSKNIFIYFQLSHKQILLIYAYFGWIIVRFYVLGFYFNRKLYNFSFIFINHIGKFYNQYLDHIYPKMFFETNQNRLFWVVFW